MTKNRKLAVLLVAGLLTLAATVIGAPELKISEEEFTFGIAPQHARMSHVFWLKSVGDDTLKISKVVPGCGCTKAPIENNVLAPGDSTRLEVIFASRSYTGRVTKAPKIHTNASDKPDMVKIYTQVVPKPDTTTPLVIAPYKLDLTSRVEKAGDRVTFRIMNKADRPIGMKLIDQPEGYFGLEIPSQIGPGETLEVPLTCLEPAATNHYEKSFTIELDDEAHTRYTVPVKR